jgi:hypothetical protein
MQPTPHSPLPPSKDARHATNRGGAVPPTLDNDQSALLYERNDWGGISTYAT